MGFLPGPESHPWLERARSGVSGGGVVVVIARIPGFGLLVVVGAGRGL